MAILTPRWLAYNANTLEDAAGSLSVKLVSSADGGALEATANGINVRAAGITNDMLAGNIADDKLAESYLKVDGTRPMAGILNMGGNRISNLGAPVLDADAATKGYVDSRVSTGVTWEFPVFVPEQLDSTSDAVLAAVAFWLENNTDLANGDVIYLAKGATQESYTVGTDFNVGATIQETLENLAAAINANSTVFSARVTNDLGSMAPAVLVIWEKDDSAGDSRIWGTVASATKPKINADYSGHTGTDLPDADPTTSNFGQRKTTADLIDQETHLVRESDEAYTWDSDTGTWQMITSGSIPLASKTVAGKVQIGDGIAVNSGVISIDLSAVSGLELVGTSPYKTLEISDSIAGDGLTITNKVLAVGAGDAISVSADAVSVVAADLAGTGLEDDGANNLRISAAAAGDGLVGGSGQPLAVGAGDGITVAANSVSVNVSDLAGAGLEDDGANNLRISAAAAGDGLIGGSGQPLAVGAGDGITVSTDAVSVNVADIAGAGLEDDGANNLRISAAAAGDGLIGGSGAPLAVGAGNGISVTADAVALGTLSANWNIGGTYTIEGVPTPTADDQVANKAYVDTRIHSINSRTVETFTLTATDITNKYIDLGYTPASASAVVAQVKGAPWSFYGDDYQMNTATPNRLEWNGLGWDGVLEAGDKITVVYDRNL